MKRLASVVLTGSAITASLGAQSTLPGGLPNMTSSPGEPAGVHPVYLSGKVAMQDGTPVPQNVTVQRVCGGIAKTVAYTTPNGRFSFQWGDRNVIVADASDAGADPSRNSTTSPGFGSSQSAGGGNALASDPYGKSLINCELRASVAGFTSDSINLFIRRSGDNSDVGTIVLHRVAGVEGTSVSVTSMMAPKDARKPYERGLQLLLKNKPAEAAKEFEKATGAYPKYADAWMNLGKVRIQLKSIDGAREAFRKAIEADAKLIPPYIEMGLLAASDGNWKESAQYLDEALRLDPLDYPQTWYADAVAHFNLGNDAAAEKSARQAVRLDPKHLNLRADYLLGLILLNRQQYAEAASELTTYVTMWPNAPDVVQARERLKEAETGVAAARK